MNLFSFKGFLYYLLKYNDMLVNENYYLNICILIMNFIKYMLTKQQNVYCISIQKQIIEIFMITILCCRFQFI